MITLTDTAAIKVKQLIDAEGDEDARAPRGGPPRRVLRVRLRDVLRHRHGRGRRRSPTYGDVKVVVDPSSAQLLTGATLDYKDGLEQSGFAITNPNAQRTCGCGQSFS